MEKGGKLRTLTGNGQFGVVEADILEEDWRKVRSGLSRLSSQTGATSYLRREKWETLGRQTLSQIVEDVNTACVSSRLNCGRLRSAPRVAFCRRIYGEPYRAAVCRVSGSSLCFGAAACGRLLDATDDEPRAASRLFFGFNAWTAFDASKSGFSFMLAAVLDVDKLTHVNSLDIQSATIIRSVFRLQPSETCLDSKLRILSIQLRYNLPFIAHGRLPERLGDSLKSIP